MAEPASCARGFGLGLVELLGEVNLKEDDLGAFFFGKLDPPAFFVDFGALDPLLHHLAEERENLFFAHLVAAKPT